MKYLAHDGAVFNTEHECLDHENKLDAEARERASDAAKVQDLANKFIEAEKLYKEGLSNYFNKHHCVPPLLEDGISVAVIKSTFPWM